ncbi:MAG: GNAT family N-acetyltransferase [Thermoguttaceae bacterium]
MRITPVTSETLRESLELAFNFLDEVERCARVQAFHDQYEHGQLRINGMFAAYVGNENDAADSNMSCTEKLAGAIFSQDRNDGTVLVVPPGVRIPEAITEKFGESERVLLEREIRLALYNRVNEYLQETGADIEVLLIDDIGQVDVEEITTSTEQGGAGFKLLSELAYLCADESAFPFVLGKSRLKFEPMRVTESVDLTADPSFREMAELVEHTYIDTADFPELSGITPAEEILNGYKFNGVFNGNLWFFIKSDGENIGALILTEQEDADQLELTYMGLVPEQRSKGFGPQIVQFALWTAKNLRKKFVIVSVDAKNYPAVKSYQKSGFRIWDRKSLFVKFLKEKKE